MGQIGRKKLILLFLVGVVIIVAILVPVVIHLTDLSKGGTSRQSGETRVVKENERLDCFPERGWSIEGAAVVEEQECKERGCLFEQSSNSRVPNCFINPSEYGYALLSSERNSKGWEFRLRRMHKVSLFGGDINDIVIFIHMAKSNALRIKIYDPNNPRYEVPVPIIWNKEQGASDLASRLYLIDFNTKKDTPFWFKIIRKDNNRVLLDTTIGGLTFADKFLQIATRLPSRNVYGFGENRKKSFRQDLNYKTWPMFSRDQPPGWKEGANLYSVQPFYTVLEEGGKSHGVFLLNSNAMDYHFTPAPSLTLRAIGGILDFYMFLGPSSEDVIKQYSEVIDKPVMPPYWSLGFHLCRYGWDNLADVQGALERTQKYEIPIDVQYVDIEYMNDRRIFTIDDVNYKGLKPFFEDIQLGGMHTVIILDPTIPYNVTDIKFNLDKQGKEKDIFIQWPEGKAPPEDEMAGGMLGWVWPPRNKVLFPDFFKNATKQLWNEWVEELHTKIPFDGLWLDMNEPANFDTNKGKPFNQPLDYPSWNLNCSISEEPPYGTMATHRMDKRLSAKTICLSTRQGENQTYEHYDVHSLYGWSMTESNYQGMKLITRKRPLLLVRSMYPTSHRYAAHWTGDNDSKWKDLHESIISMLDSNLFGIPFVGDDICGFWNNATAELCMRWMQLGSFYPYCRNHNGRDDAGLRINDQDPGYFGDMVGIPSRKAIQTRYNLLPYLYTLLSKAHRFGGTVARPLHHEWPEDEQTYDNDRQFMWGNSLLISPIMHKLNTSRVFSYYLPRGKWYDFRTHKSITVHHGLKETIGIDWDTEIPLHVRGGTILPMQESANNTKYSRENPLDLLVALNGSAFGELFWDDGDSIDTIKDKEFLEVKFTGHKGFLLSEIVNSPSTKDFSRLKLGTVSILGVEEEPKYVHINNASFTAWRYNSHVKTLEMPVKEIGVEVITPFKITWSSKSMSHEEAGSRVNCMPDQLDVLRITPEQCAAKQCTYDPTVIPRVPSCYIDKTKSGYEVQQNSFMSDDETSDTMFILKSKPGSLKMYGENIENLKLEVFNLNEKTLRLKVTDNSTDRYEVPVPLHDVKRAFNETDKRYKFSITNTNPFSFTVTRTSNNQTIWDTSLGGFVYSDQFLQISTFLPSESIYGFGENHHFQLQHDLDYRTWPMFARDQGVNWNDYANLYGVHPFYMCIEGDGKAHGVFFFNSNAQEVYLTPKPALTYRSIGGIFDIYYFIGDNPEDVIKQYHQLIGFAVMPAYWGLGHQFSRYGYKSLKVLNDTISRNLAAGVPFDTQNLDIDHLHERMDFTYDEVNFPDLPNFVSEMREKNKLKFIVLVDPALVVNVSWYQPYQRGKDRKVYVMWPEGESPDLKYADDGSMIGLVWPPGRAAFPDYFNPEAGDWWVDELVEHRKNISFDGLWIDMNEPANFGTNEEKPWSWPDHDRPFWSLKCPESKYDDPPYKPVSVLGSRISEKTVCMVGLHNNGNRTFKHYNVHSLYGWSMAIPSLRATRKATGGKRSVLITRSTFPGAGQYAGHWTGDNDADWKNLRNSIIGMIEFNMFGIPYVGADICGFFGNSEEELCLRWTQLGAFYPFSRNHNGLDNQEQDPAYYSGSVKHFADVLRVRYSLLPHLYTLFHHVNTEGGTIVRSLAHNYPRDINARAISYQFMWSDTLLFSPATEKGQVKVDAYIPQDRWYDFFTGEEVAGMVGTRQDVSAPLDKIPIHIRGGSVLPMQEPGVTTTHSRMNPFMLKIAVDSSTKAKGDLFVDDGESVDTYKENNYYYAEMDFEMNRLLYSVEKDRSQDYTNITKIWIYGLPTKMNWRYSEGVGCTGGDMLKSEFDPSLSVTTITNDGLAMDKSFCIWGEEVVPTTTTTTTSPTIATTRQPVPTTTV